jgi:hypothetical protein
MGNAMQSQYGAHPLAINTHLRDGKFSRKSMNTFFELY